MEVVDLKTDKISYLKKKKMYELLEQLVSADLSMMKNSSYRYFRGSEWLECAADDGQHYTIYKLYHEGRFVSLDILKWDDEEENFVEDERITYRMVDGQLIKNYQRTEAYEKTEKIKEWLKTQNLIIK